MTQQTPPRPRCAFRVAAIGHRWDRLPVQHADAVRKELQQVLDIISRTISAMAHDPSSGFAGKDPTLTLFSGLAEGADRLAAQCALDASVWQLHAVAPFDIAHYELDFHSPTSPPQSVEHFRTLWRAAHARTVIDGPRGDFDAYVPLARVLVDLSDLLIVVWDGERSRGPGGTPSSVEMARLADMPIVRIDANHPSQCWLEDLKHPDHGRHNGLKALEARVASLLAAPPSIVTAHHAPLDLCADYFAERVVTRPLPRGYDRAISLLQARTTDGASRPLRERVTTPASPRVPGEPGEASRVVFDTRWHAMPDPIRTAMLDRFAEHHGWADRLATQYAARFRQTFTWIFRLAFVDVLAAFLSAVHGDLRVWGVSAAGVLEIGVLVAINHLVRSGRRHRLHERWLDYRSLAERLRHLAVLWPMARSTPLVRVPADAMRDDPRQSWVGWMLRAVARDAGLVAVTFDAHHANACRNLLRDAELTPQRQFHAATRSRAAQVQHALTSGAEWLFRLALALALVHLGGGLAIHAGALPEPVGRTLELIVAGCCVAFPAIAASIHGFLGTGDFAGMTMRSAAIEPRLAQIDTRLARLDPVDTTGVGDLAAQATALMESELVTWHTVTATRELETP